MFTTRNWNVAGIIEAPAGDVFSIIMAIHKDNARRLFQLKEYQGIENSHYFEVDTDAKTIIVRGGYWYEAVYTIAAKGEHTQLSFKVNNIGPKSKTLPLMSKWLVPIWQHKLPVSMKLEMEGYLKNISEQLNCKAYYMDKAS